MLALLAVSISLLSFFYYLRRGDVLLYGDAIAHINIARRVFDSRTPGLLQLGTVWLPLPHLLMIPFLLSNKLWQTGIGGSIPALFAYVLGVIGIFRLLRGIFRRNGETSGTAKVASWSAALVYAANPNLIYMQSTAMGEPLYLVFFIWSVVYLSEYWRGDPKALTKCGLCLAAACWTRYDGWFLAVVICAVVVGRALILRLPSSRTAIIKFILIAAAAPVLWLAYNAIIYRNPLEFENGPYSAKAIEKKTQSAGSVGHPGSGNLYLSGLYFLKSAESNLAANTWLQRLWITLGLVAIVLLIVNRHAKNLQELEVDERSSPQPWPLALLLIPLPFYALSVAYGGVPIFIPAWWPFTHYNVRYGLELLPAFAVAFAIVVYQVLSLYRTGQLLWVRRPALLGLFVLLAASYISIWNVGPVCYLEASLNMRSRNALEKQVADWLKLLPPDSTLLMYVGDHVGAVQQAGLPLKHTINEGNHRMWMQPNDPEGLWERTLADPAAHADYVVAFEGDTVWQAVHDRHFKELVEIEVSGQSRAILYRLR